MNHVEKLNVKINDSCELSPVKESNVKMNNEEKLSGEAIACENK